jgi:hypothetical protein
VNHTAHTAVDRHSHPPSIIQYVSMYMYPEQNTTMNVQLNGVMVVDGFAMKKGPVEIAISRSSVRTCVQQGHKVVQSK